MTPEVWGVVIAAAGLFVIVMGGLFGFIVKISNGVGRLTEHVKAQNGRIAKNEEQIEKFGDRQYQEGLKAKAKT